MWNDRGILSTRRGRRKTYRQKPALQHALCFRKIFDSRRVECPLHRESRFIKTSFPFFTLPPPLFHIPFSLFLYGWLYSLIETAFFPLLAACWLQRGRSDRFEIKVMIGNGSYFSASAIREKHSKHFHMIASVQNKVSRLR